jgi:xanthine dehydrogenase accessory factor
VAELIDQRRRFVQATVVRAQCPTSARPGDAAIVLPDGSIEGFVGGQCVEESVRSVALDVLSSGESMLLRILPDDGDVFPDAPGAVTTVNPCLSGGAIEVFLEPKLPAARIVVVGGTPIADALVRLGGPLGLAMDAADDGSEVEGATAVVIASHGR